MICQDCLFGYHETPGQKDCHCPCHGLTAQHKTPTYKYWWGQFLFEEPKVEAINHDIKIRRPRLSLAIAA